MTPFLTAWLNTELSLLDFISDTFSCAFFDGLMPFLSSLCAHGEIWIALALLMLCFAPTRRTGAAMAVALICGLVFGNILLKPLVARVRPYEYREITLLVARLSDYSFPSGHTLASFEAAGVLALRRSRLAVPSLILACFIAFSRLYLYVRFPSDVLAGIVLGLLFAYFAVKITDRRAAVGERRMAKLS